MLTQVKTIGAGGAYDIANYGITGQPYTSNDVFYNSGGQKTSETWSNGTALYQSETWNADGSTDIRHYAAGALDGVAFASSEVHTTAAGVHDKTTTYDASGNSLVVETFQTNGGFTFLVGGILTEQKTADPGGAYGLAFSAITGQAYSSYENIYNAARVEVAQTRDLTTGAGTLILLGNGLTTSVSSGGSSPQESVTTGSDVFAINPHWTDTINASGETCETFTYGSGFGASAINGFLATGATHDTLQVQLSMFSNLNASLSQTQDVAALLSDGKQVGANYQFLDAAGDVLTLNNVSKATLAANPGDFKFV